MTSAYLLLLAPLTPLLLGALLLVRPFSSRHARNLYVMAAGCLTSLLALWLVLAPPAGELTLLWLGGQPALCFRLDSLGRVFVALVAVLWPLTNLYSFEYMQSEGHEARFFAFFTMTYGVVLGLALAGSTLTLYLFYELLTLTTLPLVMHAMDGRARMAGKRYLLYCMTGAAMGFVAVCFILFYGSCQFIGGGSLSPALVAGHEDMLRLVYLLAFFGFGVKAAIFPFQDWLPAAGIAPTPVTALLHAVAVVNGGVFAVLRVTYYNFGAELLRGSFAQFVPMAFAVLSLSLGSCLALRQNHLKRRLAYSTMANLSYILFAATLMSAGGLTAALTHMVVHSVLKITLFFCAGGILCRSHHQRDHIDMYEGLGLVMPLTFGAFTIASLGLIGIPPFAAFGSKMLIAQVAMESGLPLAALGCLGLVFSTFMTGIYQLTVVIPAFWPHDREAAAAHNAPMRECGWKIRLVYILLTLLALALAFGMAPLQAAMTRAAAGAM